jgi:hypothetical protein
LAEIVFGGNVTREDQPDEAEPVVDQENEIEIQVFQNNNIVLINSSSRLDLSNTLFAIVVCIKQSKR